MIRQRPSDKLRNSHADLLLAVREFGNLQQARDVPFLDQKQFDLQLSLQLAMIERLDAILQMTEHRVVDHICKVDGHDHINKKKITPNGKKGGDEGEMGDVYKDLGIDPPDGGKPDTDGDSSGE